MNEDIQLITLDLTRRQALPTVEVETLRDAALAQSALIGRVTNAEEQTKAVEAQSALARFCRLLDKAESASKAPLNELRGAIGELADKLRGEVEAEGMRIAGLVGEFQEFERIRVQAVQKAQRDELEKIERERAAEVAKAPTLEAQEEVNDKYSRLAAGTVQPVTPARTRGQRIETEWEITVTDIHALYRMYPNCVKLTERLSEIKAILDMLPEGQTMAGVSAKKKIKAGVRLAPERKAIEI